MNRSPIQWFLTIAGLSGIASIFLPFTPGFMESLTSAGLFKGVSPIDVVAELMRNFTSVIRDAIEGSTGDYIMVIGLMGIPFLLSVFISASLIRWNLTGRSSLLEQIITYLIGLSMMAVVIRAYFAMLQDSSEVMPHIFSASSLIAGIFLVVRNHRIGKFRNLSPIMLMQTAYLGNGIFCLIGFWRSWEIGAYFGLATVIVYAAQMVWISCQKKTISVVKPQEL